MHELRLEIKKKKPSQNAKKYYIITIDDLFQVATVKNHKRLLKAFSDSMKICVSMRQAMGEAKEPLHLKGWEWIDD